MDSKLAFVFPGQGSQHLGMLGELAEAHNVIGETFAEASDVIGVNLWSLAQQGPDEELNKTENTQPLLLTASVALWKLWQQLGGRTPGYMAGHSLGEYTALVCSGAMSLVDGVRLVRTRGELMQEAVSAGQGAMAAILGLDDSVVEACCDKAAEGQIVSAVNYNSPGQLVIAGEAAAVERAMVLCKEAGAKRALPLSVSVPSHCMLMKPAADRLAAIVADVELVVPAIAVVQNVDAQVSDSLEGIRERLLKQLYSPVLWTRSVEFMVAQGVETMLECGPGKVLSGLNKRIARALDVAAINDPASLASALA
ncbi:malonyl CoA-ACP transacylase [Pokkaliibacter plantistimulans]|uniref:Malonyl CoA-acyl carrier protein transacylase n=1 Tax=Pokkaliibacter plantistimulans TaxID=1635171 RepID=A0ABX5M6B1_9GAMM|nr:ACP S-malonyltransferase [Pokkaliibacter plantistimulans]PXF33216.1 malonyl CoA-ACP transacylase [Pokkaliibacter plantistimulans]